MRIGLERHDEFAAVEVAMTRETNLGPHESRNLRRWVYIFASG
jgi:hypothetical protein